MANRITGRKARIGPVRSMPNSSLPYPSWKTATTTPNAAAADSRFITAAVAATTRLRKTAVSSRNDSSTTTPTNSGSLSAMTALKSWKIAVAPPTSTSWPLPATARGTRSSRSRCTSRSVSTSWGADRG